MAELIGHGVTEAMARQLVAEYDEDKIRQQMEILGWQEAKKPGKISDPAAWLVIAIKNGHATPKGFVSAAERQKQQDARQARERQAAEDRRQKQQQEAAEKADKKAIAAYWDSLTPEQQREVDAASMAAADPDTLANETGPFQASLQRLRREGYLLQRLRHRSPADA